jgi:hypothetical protein
MDAVLVMLIKVLKKFGFWTGFHWHNVPAKLHYNRHICSKTIMENTQVHPSPQEVVFRSEIRLKETTALLKNHGNLDGLLFHAHI